MYDTAQAREVPDHIGKPVNRRVHGFGFGQVMQGARAYLDATAGEDVAPGPHRQAKVSAWHELSEYLATIDNKPLDPCKVVPMLIR